MQVYVDAADIRVEVRCGKCSSCIYILDQYEYNGVLTVDVSTCEECKDD